MATQNQFVKKDYRTLVALEDYSTIGLWIKINIFASLFLKWYQHLQWISLTLLLSGFFVLIKSILSKIECKVFGFKLLDIK